MRKNRLIVFMLLLVMAGFGGYVLNDSVNTAPATKQPQITIYKPVKTPLAGNGPTAAEALVEGIAKANKLITAEVSLQAEILVDDSYLDIHVLKKQQVIRFYATALFTTDLSGITGGDIAFERDNKTLCVSLGRPRLTYMHMDNEKTLFYEPENGILRFGSLQLTAEEFSEIQTLAQNEMAAQVASDEITRISGEHAEQALKGLFGAILEAAGFEGYEIKILFDTDV